MSSQGYTQVKSSQDNDGAVSKGTASRNSTSKASISSGKMGKKAGINLTSVESLLFFNMVCFNRDPGNSMYLLLLLGALSLALAACPQNVLPEGPES